MLQKNIRRYKIVEKHIEWVKTGEYVAARNLLWLLRKGYVKLGLGNTDWQTESFLEGVGCSVRYDRNGYIATFKI